jgi:hypothetical protein
MDYSLNVLSFGFSECSTLYSHLFVIVFVQSFSLSRNNGAAVSFRYYALKYYIIRLMDKNSEFFAILKHTITNFMLFL